MQPQAFPYNDTAFRLRFPAFADINTYPAQTLEMYFNAAGLYVANSNYGFLAAAGATLPALFLMTAHLAQIGSLIATGQNSGITTSATIDKISVGLQEAKLSNQWQYWLASTEYGKQLLALLQVQSVGGFYQPGGLGRAGFRA